MFVFPAAVALLLAGFCWWALRDTPQSCGLPAIDQYRNDIPAKKEMSSDKKIPAKELFVKYIFKNKVLWLIALANVFVYLIRYGIGDWSPTYCQEAGLLNSEQSKMAFSLHNYAGVPGTILIGWISTKMFKGRCAPANVIFMLLVLVCVILYWKAAPVASFLSETLSTDPDTTRVTVVYSALIAIGFFIYGPVALIGIQAINLVPKNAAGTAAGFVGLFGYLIGDALLSKVLIGAVADNVKLGWEATFWIFIVASILAALFSATTWKKEKATYEGH